jgi:hypothetical protein
MRPAHSHRWQALLPAQTLATAEPDRANLRELKYTLRDVAARSVEIIYAATVPIRAA